MMKLHISVWSETTSLVRVINKNLSAIKSYRRFAEAPFIGAATESPLKKLKAMKIKIRDLVMVLKILGFPLMCEETLGVII